MTGETVKTPRGNFYITDMSREQMEAAGFGFHHASEDGKYLIMGNGTQAFAIAAEQPQKKLSILKKLDEYKKQAAQQPIGRRAHALFLPLRGQLESCFLRFEYPLSAMPFPRFASRRNTGFFSPYRSTFDPLLCLISCFDM